MKRTRTLSSTTNAGSEAKGPQILNMGTAQAQVWVGCSDAKKDFPGLRSCRMLYNLQNS